MITSRSIWIGIALIALMAPRADASPEIGDKAPPLGISGWLGDKPESLPGDEKAGEHVYVITLWASWHNRSLALLPLLHELQSDNADKGLIVIAISNEEADDIAPHIKTDAKKSAFFALDGNVTATETWADDTDIPIVYVLSQDNVVAWKGDPSRQPGEVEQVIRKLFDGTFDLEAAKNAEDNERKYQELMSQLQTAYSAGKEAEVFKIVDQMIAIKPAELHPYFIKRQMIQLFHSYMRLPAHISAMEIRFKDSPADLAKIIDVELNFEIGDRNPAFLMRCADRLSELTKDRDPTALTSIAAVYAEMGLHGEAIDLMKKAVVLMPPGEDRHPMEMQLAYYEAIERVRDQRSKKPKQTTTAPSAEDSKSH